MNLLCCPEQLLHLVLQLLVDRSQLLLWSVAREEGQRRVRDEGRLELGIQKVSKYCKG